MFILAVLLKFTYKNLYFGPLPLGFRVLNSLNIPLSVETVCVFTAPIFSAFASWATYLLTKVCPSQNHIQYFLCFVI